MRGKLLFAAGLAVGYIVGARAGRPAYDALAERVRGGVESPAVQEIAGKAKETLEQKAPQVAAVAEQAAATAAGVAVAARSASQDSDSEAGEPDGSSAAQEPSAGSATVDAPSGDGAGDSDTGDSADDATDSGTEDSAGSPPKPGPSATSGSSTRGTAAPRARRASAPGGSEA